MKGYEHGTNSHYVNHGCRCVDCKRAHTAANKAHNQARAEARVALVKRHRAEFQLIYERICLDRGLSNKVGPPYA